MTIKEFLPSFGRRHGRSLTSHQQRLVDELLPTLIVNPSGLPQNTAICLEIGFGGGEHLVAQAKANPDVLFIGCEPYINGVAKLLTQIDQEKINNIRLFTEDARLLVRQLPDASVNAVFILFPDPWPKLRHNKRRIVSQETLSLLARIQPAGARLLLATDHIDYSAWMFEHVLAHPHYEWRAKSKTDWENPPADWVQTRYQRKTTEQGRNPVFIECVRV